MIYLYWALGILLFLILALLFVPFKLNFYYLEDFRLSVGFLMFKYRLFPNDKKAEEEKDTEEKESRPKKKKENKEQQEDKEEKKLTLKEKLKLVIKILKEVRLPFKKFLKKVKIRKLKLEILVGSTDPFDTGKNYAIISESIYLILELLESLFDLKADSIYVYPDFKEEKNKYYIEGTVKTDLMQVIILLICVMRKSGRDIMKLI